MSSRRGRVVLAALGVALAGAVSFAMLARSADPDRGCGTTVAHFDTKPYERTVLVPPSPSLTATRSGAAVRFRWSFTAMPKSCRPVLLMLSLRDAGSNTPAFTPNAFKISAAKGVRSMTPPPEMKAVWALASALDASGLRSTTVWARITG